MNHPLLQDLDPVKLELIKMAARQTQGKSGKSMAPIMMSIITSANRKGIRFTPEEFSLILDILKEGKSNKEKQQIDQMVSMVQQLKKNGPPAKKREC